MKILGLFVFLMSLSAFANNPQERACRLTGGLFHAVRLNSDQVGFCLYGSAMLDSISVMESASSGSSSQAVNAFLKSEISCSASAGVEKSVIDLEGNVLEICFFADQSAIGLQTLTSGPQADQNAGLVHGLKVRY